MDPTIHQGQRPVSDVYRLFAERAARGVSRVYEDWASRLAKDVAVLARLKTLPPGKRQLNLVLADAPHGREGPGHPDVRHEADEALGHLVPAHPRDPDGGPDTPGELRSSCRGSGFL